MPLKNTTQHNVTEKHNKGIIVIHWVTTILILILFPLGKYMEGMNFSEKSELLKVHVIIGLLVLNLTILRVYFYFKYPRPSSLKKGSKLNNQLVVWIHNTFYFLLLGISVSGIASIFWGNYLKAMQANFINDLTTLNSCQKSPLEIHGVLAGIMMVLLVIHIIGVIKHYLLTKENTFKRIT